MKKIISILMCLLIIPTVCTNSFLVYSENTENENQEEQQENPYPSGNVPQVYITTENRIGFNIALTDGYIPADIAITDTRGNTIHESGKVKLRGNSTAIAAKKPLTIKFDSKQNVLGMGKAKKWILLAECLDPTLMRNHIALTLAQHMGMNYTSDHYYAELYMEGIYRGCYIITEPVEAKASRVNIDVDGNDGMKDFLIQFELSRDDEESTYFTSEDYRFKIKDPAEPSEEQTEYIQSTMTDIIKVLKSQDYEEIKKVIDTESFAKYYLLNELVKNVDFGYSSAYFYYKNDILYAGPCWDYDLTMGNINTELLGNAIICFNPKGLFVNTCQLFTLLCSYKEFIDEVREIYRENYDYIENIYAEGGLIDTTIATYSSEFDRNFNETKWDVSAQYWVLMMKPKDTYEENVEYLRNWLKQRNEWLSEYYMIFSDEWLLFGDINQDCQVNISDMTILEKYLLGQESLTEEQYKNSDINKDGVVDTFDMVSMRKLLTENW